MMHGFGQHGWGMGWWWIVGLVCMVFIVWIVVKVLKPTNPTNAQLGNKSALDILNERYALGEIEKEEFEERKSNLE